jgi:hypothetical protein
MVGHRFLICANGSSVLHEHILAGKMQKPRMLYTRNEIGVEMNAE